MKGQKAISDYELYYWSMPFRGQLVRAVPSYAGNSWAEMGDAASSDLMEGPVADMSSRNTFCTGRDR